MPKIACTAMLLGIMLAVQASERTEYGGWTGIKGKATGFFHVQRIGTRWWCIDPSGAVFYAIGTDHVNYNVHWCEALGYAPYAQNVRKKYNNDESAWAKSSTDRLKIWNFNALGANNSPSTRGRGLAYMEFCGMGADYAGKDPLVDRVHWTGFPNVFNPSFAEYCEEKARAQCAPLKDDPWLFGWFLDNELEWFGKSGVPYGLADEAIKRPATHEAKKALTDLLKKKYKDIASFNAIWGTSFTSWDEALASTSWNEQSNEKVIADKIEFVRLCADKYFSVTTSAIRKADPNHMILGCRFAGNAPPVWDIAGKYCDIVSFNIYGPVDLETLVPIGLVDTLTNWYKQAKRPMMVTEWSFPALDAGLPCRAGAGMRVRTQSEKAKCFEVYQKTFFSLPFMVGSDYFMWVDEPALGIAKTFPEDSNYGLVDVNDEPWELFTQTVARVNAKAYQIHSGKTAEITITGIEMVDASGGKEVRANLKNSGRIEAKVPVVLKVDDMTAGMTLTIPKRGKGWVQMKYILKPGAHYVEALADPEGTLDEVNMGDNKLSRFVYVASPVEKGIPIGVYSPSGGRHTVFLTLPESGPFRLVDGAGKEVDAEILDLDGSGTASAGDIVVFQVNAKPKTTQTFYLDKSGSARLIQPEIVEHFDLDTGVLKLSGDKTHDKAIASIKLGELEMGTFTPLIQQVAGGTWWDRPTAVSQIRIWKGSLTTRLEVTTSRTNPGKDSGPFAYETTYAFDFVPNKPWFTARFLSLKNTDTRSWTMESYFYYAQSAIGGDPADDEVGLVGACGSAAWVDRKAGAAYGAIAPSSAGVTVLFWKDDAGNQHADIRKMTNKLLKPGDTYNQPGGPIYLYCAPAKEGTEPWKPIEEEIASLPKIEVFR